MSLADLQDAVKAYYEEARSYGRACRAVVQGNTVVAGGKAYQYDTAVPLNVRDGMIVYIHVTGNGRAVIIGGA